MMTEIFTIFTFILLLLSIFLYCTKKYLLSIVLSAFAVALMFEYDFPWLMIFVGIVFWFYAGVMLIERLKVRR